MPANQEQINKDLAEKDSQNSEFQKALKEQVTKYLNASSETMSSYWESWEEHDKIYRGYRIPDRDDRESNKKKQPVKMIVPMSYAQIQTALSFLFSTFTQRRNIFELEGRSPEDQVKALVMEQDIAFQLEKQQFLFTLYNWMLDTAKLGFGVVKTHWDEETVKLRSRQPVPMSLTDKISSMFGGQSEINYEETVIEVPSYEGNYIKPISPFCFLPDPDVPLSRINDGLFVAHEEEVSRAILKQKEGSDYFGTDMIKGFNQELFRARRRRVGNNGKSGYKDVIGMTKEEHNALTVVTEVQMKIVPADWSKKYKVDFGQEKDPICFIAVIANDNKVIQFKPQGYLHGKFNYNLMEYSPDHNNFYNPGLSETIYYLQDTISWYINSHMINVKQALHNRFIVDPSKIHVEDIEAGRMAIRTKGSAMRDLRSAIDQLNVQDVTKNHISDVDSLNGIVQLVTGINENALGQFAQGRRSAAEARAVNSSAAARLRMHAQLMWTMGLKPLAEVLLANTRQGRSEQMYRHIHGKKADEVPFENVILATPEEIAGAYDFIPYDGTLPSDKERRSGLLSDLLTTMLQNPEAAQVFGLNPIALLNRIAELQGFKNLDEFRIQPQLNPIDPQVMPDDQALAAAQAQGGVPVDMTGVDLINQLQQG